jgi:hypothetical protein
MLKVIFLNIMVDFVLKYTSETAEIVDLVDILTPMFDTNQKGSFVKIR